MHSYKLSFLRQLLLESPASSPVKVLELGCGTAPYVEILLNEFPLVQYTGVEQREASLNAARGRLNQFIEAGRVKLLSDYGERVFSKSSEQFDLVISLSVVEHVKYLRSFIEKSVAVCRIGGVIAHRFDLGHALHSKSIRERWKVAVANRYPWLVPASHFTFRPRLIEVCRLLESSGARVVTIEHSQMPSLKQSINILASGKALTAETMNQVMNLEQNLVKQLAGLLSEDELDLLFPTIAIVAVRTAHIGPQETHDQQSRRSFTQ